MLRFSPSLEFRPAAAPSPNATAVQYQSRTESHTANPFHISERENMEPSGSDIPYCMKQSQLQSMLDVVREANHEKGAAVPLGEFLEHTQRELDKFEAALENLVASAAARLMESLVQALLDSQPPSNSSKATQIYALQTTTGYKSETTQTDAAQISKLYDSKATQTDTLGAPTLNEDCKKIARSGDPPVQLPMAQQPPRGSRAVQTDITELITIDPVSDSLRVVPRSGHKRSPWLQKILSKGTLAGGSFTSEHEKTGHSDDQKPPAVARLRQADPDPNTDNGTIDVKSTIDEAMEKYHSNLHTLAGARTVAPQSKQTKPFTQTSLGIGNPRENESTASQTRKLVNGKSPLEDTADRRSDAARRDIVVRGSTSIGLPYDQTPVPDSVLEHTLRTRNGLNEVARSSIPETEELNGFSTCKTTTEKLFSQGELIVCLPEYAPLYLTPPTTPRRTSMDVINISRNEMEVAPVAQTLSDVACLEKVEKQKLKPAEISEVAIHWQNVKGRNFDGYHRTEEKPKISPRKSPNLVAQKKLHVENAGPDPFYGLLDLVKRK